MNYREALERLLQQERDIARQGLPPQFDLAVQRAILYAHLQDGDNALAALAEAELIEQEQDLDPSPRIPINRGAVLSRLSRIDEALAELSRAENIFYMQGQIVHPAVYINRGSMLSTIGNVAAALEAYTMADRNSEQLQLPRHHTLQLNRAVILIRLTRYDEALKALDEAAERCHTNSEVDDGLIELNRGLVLANLHRFDEARASLDRSAQQAQELGIAPQPLVFLHRAVMFLLQGDTATALKSIQESHEIFLRNGEEIPQIILQYEKEILMRAATDSARTIPVTQQQTRLAAKAGKAEAGARGLGDSCPIDKQFDVFISHRRRDGHAYARLIKLNLEMRGLRAFLDLDDRQPTTRFDERIMRSLEQVRTFIVLLTPGALDRCREVTDWLRREISYALELGKDIVPVMMPDFHWPQAVDLPEDIRQISLCEGLSYSHEYFAAFIDMLTNWCNRTFSGSLTTGST